MKHLPGDGRLITKRQISNERRQIGRVLDSFRLQLSQRLGSLTERHIRRIPVVRKRFGAIPHDAIIPPQLQILGSMRRLVEKAKGFCNKQGWGKAAIPEPKPASKLIKFA